MSGGSIKDGGADTDGDIRMMVTDVKVMRMMEVIIMAGMIVMVTDCVKDGSDRDDGDRDEDNGDRDDGDGGRDDDNGHDNDKDDNDGSS